MELAGQRSGLGRLFIDHQQQIIGLFKKHILLYGKEGGLLFFEDVKRYFSNYIAAGSPTCRMLREELMREIKERESKDVSRFESIVDGKRMYLGRLIPDSAPPRPDNSAGVGGCAQKMGLESRDPAGGLVLYLNAVHPILEHRSSHV